MEQTCLRPGRRVDLIISTDLDRDSIDIRSTTIHNIEADRSLILAQPFPPLGPSRVGNQVELTFLARYRDVPDGRWLRVGYQTKISKIVNDYPIGQGLRDSVLIVPGPKEFKQFTLRLHFRLAPPPEFDARLYIWPDKTKVEIMDISLGGVKFSHPALMSFSVGTPISLLLTCQNKQLLLEGTSVRNGKLKLRGFSSVQFHITNQKTRRELSQLMQEMMRFKLAQRSGVKDG